ncbi:NAD(+)/NADH kinase [bacterium]|nr:NAD(+)/NADH kinase [bacterium]
MKEKILIWLSKDKKPAMGKGLRLAHNLIDKGYQVRFLPEVAELLALPSLALKKGEEEELKLVLVGGGDGTILSASHFAAPRGLPLLGVNLGRFGFLAEFSYWEASQAVDDFFQGKNIIENRMMLVAQAKDRTFYALNDVVISKGGLSRILHLETRVKGELLAVYPADGIILSTPTGSTAYSLSAGGPIIQPCLELIILTPICPHTLSARPLVLKPEEEITIRVRHPNSNSHFLTVDGQEGIPIGDELVLVTKAPFYAKFVLSSAHSFYKKVRSRLRWGARKGVE